MIFLLFSCVSDTNDITWSGNVYTLSNSQLVTAEDGGVSLLDLDDALLYEAQTPYSDSPYYNEFTISPDDTGKEAAFRVQATGSSPTIWRSTIPTSSSIWLNGSLYSISTQWAENLFRSLSLEPQNLSTSDAVYLIGRTDAPEAWIGTSLRVTDGQGTEHTVLRYYYDEGGLLLPADSTTPVDLFVAIELAPGLISLWVTPPEEEAFETLYPTRAGDIISAAYFIP